MIAPRLVWMPPDFDVAYVSKSDYDELKAKLTATQSELAKIYATEPVAVYEGVEFSRYTLRWVNGDLAVGTNFYAAPIPPTEVEPATEYAEYILDHYDRKSRKDRKLLGKHLAEWADRRYRDAAPIPSIKITNEMAYAFHRAITDSDLGSDDVAEIKKGLAAALANYAVPIPPTVTTQKFLDAEQFLAAFPVSENEIYQLGHKFLRYQTHNCNEINLVEFVRAVFEAAPIPPVEKGAT